MNETRPIPTDPRAETEPGQQPQYRARHFFSSNELAFWLNEVFEQGYELHSIAAMDTGVIAIVRMEQIGGKP